MDPRKKSQALGILIPNRNDSLYDQPFCDYVTGHCKGAVVKKVNALMTSPVVTVELDDRLSTVKKIFERRKFHHLVVVEEGKLFGVVSDRDLLRALSPHIGTAAETSRDLALLDRRVHQIMTRNPISLTENASIAEAIDAFLDKKISCIPIVNENNEPIGILSWRDIFKAMRERERARQTTQKN